jgi:hypothetical protein
MPNPLQQAGSQDTKQTHYAPLWTSLFFTGLWCQRNPLRSPGTRVETLYYGGRNEAIISGVNIELTNLLTLSRRPGVSQYSLQTVGEAINSFYSFKTFTTISETIQVMMDGLTQIYTISPAQVTSIFTKSNGAGEASFFGINNTLYIGDGVDQLAWPGFAPSQAIITNTALTSNVATYTAANNFVAGRLVTVTGTTNGSGVFNVTNAVIATANSTSFTVAIVHANVGSAADTGTAVQVALRNWGIATAGITLTSAYAGTGVSGSAGGGSGSQGPSSPFSATDSGISGPDGNEVWSNPTNAEVLDGVYASAAFSVTGGPGSDGSNYLNVTNFKFAIPSTATITGVVANVYRARSLGSGGTITTDSIQILKANVQSGTGHTGGTAYTPSITPETWGSSSDLWGATLAPSDINNSGFGIAVATKFNTSQSHATGQALIDYISVTVYYTSPVVVSWTNPTNVQGAPDGAYATTIPTADLQTAPLFATNYSFSVSGTVTGVQVNVTGHVSAVAGDTLIYARLQDNNGNAIGNQKLLLMPGTSDMLISFGGSTDVWGATLNPSIINTSNFGVQIVVSGSGQTFSIDSAQIQVFTAGISVSVGGSGALSATTGYEYGYAYANTNVSPPVFSNMTPASASTGAFSSKVVDITVVASTDPQVNTIWVFRTKDGGNTFYSLPTNPYPNTSTTIVDQSLDATLNQFQLPAQAGQNTPPPTGIGGMVFHMGRMWGFVSNVVYYATGPDLGNILGNPYESWSPANNFVFPSKVSKLIPTSVGLLVFTISDVYIIYGTGSAVAAASGVSGITVFYPAPFIQNLGLLNQFAADVNGTTIYAHTADKQFVQLDPTSGISKIGFPIGAPCPAYPNDPTLQSFNPANSYVTWHASNQDEAVHISDGSTGWFRCNTSQAPEGGFVWSPKANITGGAQAIQSIETSPGVHQLLVGPGSAVITNTSLTSNVATYTANNNFVVGQIITTVGTTNGSGIFNVANQVIVSATPTQFTTAITHANQASAADTGTAGGGYIYYRNANVFTDNGKTYPANFIMGSIVLAYPGQLAELAFITCDFNLVGTSPVLSVLLNEISGPFQSISGYVHQDPPALYGTTLAPATLYSNRYDFKQSVSGPAVPLPAWARHMQVKIDFGSTDGVRNEIFTFTVYGSHHGES